MAITDMVDLFCSAVLVATPTACHVSSSLSTYQKVQSKACRPGWRLVYLFRFRDV
jgi:hypothetical protein